MKIINIKKHNNVNKEEVLNNIDTFIPQNIIYDK
jgi:hypothetical protein